GTRLATRRAFSRGAPVPSMDRARVVPQLHRSKLAAASIAVELATVIDITGSWTCDESQIDPSRLQSRPGFIRISFCSSTSRTDARRAGQRGIARAAGHAVVVGGQRSARPGRELHLAGWDD